MPNANSFPTLADIAGRLDPDGAAAEMANVLSREDDIVNHIPWRESNLPTGHLVTQAANALSQAGWRQINQGVARTLGQSVQFVESCGILEAWTEIDQVLYELNGGDIFRASEDKLKDEGIAQQFVDALMYENVATNPERFHGFMPRYDSASSGTSSGQVHNGNLSDNANSNCHSVLAVCWGDYIYGIYPKGTMAGLERRDLGVQRIEDSSNNPYTVLSTQHIWRCGLVIADYRYAARFQWDPDSADMADSERGLIIGMAKLQNTVQRARGMRFYMDRTSADKLNIQMISNDQGPLRYFGGDGGKLIAGVDHGTAMYNGFPIHIVDGLTTETAVS